MFKNSFLIQRDSFIEILAKQLTSLFSFLLMILGVWGIHSCFELAKFKKLFLENQNRLDLLNNIESNVAYEATPYLFNFKLQSSLFLFLACTLVSFFVFYSAMFINKNKNKVVSN